MTLTKPLKTKISLTAACLYILFILLPTPVHADNLDSDNYTIQMGNINMTSGRKSSASYTLTDTVGQTFQGQFDSNGYVLLAGFQYIHSLTTFSFSISDLSIDFGSLTPSTPQTATNQLTVTTGSVGYAVTAIENHALQIPSASATIPDTSCDPATTCTISNADVWADNSAYGFGYNMSGDDINSSDFVDSTYFRPFANQANADDPVSVMSRNAAATSSATATVTYKLNVSPTQQAGTYTNLIQYIATPTF